MEFLTKNLLLSAYILEYFEFPIKIKNLKKILWQYSTLYCPARRYDKNAK